MIGKKELIIQGTDFIKGMSNSPEINDGGFSNETDGVNLNYNTGILYAAAAGVDSDTDTRLTGNLIASSPDMAISTPDNRLLVADNDTYYRYNGTKIIAAAYTGGTASTTAAGFTDIVTYSGSGSLLGTVEAYVSCKERIKRWENSNTITDLGSFTNTTVPHPLLVYANNMYAGDGNVLRRATAVNTMPTAVLTLAANQIIIALGIDPGTGLMLISTTSTIDVSSTLSSISKILWYNGSDGTTVKEVIVDSTILSFHPVGGYVFVGYGTSIGYINGSGISWVTDLQNATLTQTELPYKHHMTHIGKTLYVADGGQIYAFGEVLQGKKVHYFAFKNNVNSNKFTLLADVGSNKLGFGFATTKFYTTDTSSVSTTNTLIFYTNKYTFPRPVFLRSCYVEYADAIAANDDNRSLYYQSENKQSGLQILRVQGTTAGGGLKNSSSASVYFIDNVIGFLNNKVRSVQFRYLANTVNSGLKRIILYYDIAD